MMIDGFTNAIEAVRKMRGRGFIKKEEIKEAYDLYKQAEGDFGEFNELLLQRFFAKSAPKSTRTKIGKYSGKSKNEEYGRNWNERD